MTYVLGIDVGSGSARCGVFDREANLCGVGKHDIAQHRPAPDFVEQASTDIWSAICSAVAQALADAQVSGTEVAALAYSATCSLVLLDQDHTPLALSVGDVLWDIIMWMDHRAGKEAAEVNKTGSAVLENLGGQISVEMEIPKLMWVKRNRPDLWARLGYAGDLADYLALRSCGTLERSACTVACKWTYDPDRGGWDDAFLAEVGLEDLRDRAALPAQASPIGAPVGQLTASAAHDLGLSEACQVGVGLIDAHAGALGTAGLQDDGLEHRLALIAGTSNCHIALTKGRVEVPGVWGPYAGAVLDGWYCLEGGQSATGAALDQVLAMFGTPGAHDRLGTAYLAGLAQDPGYGADIQVLPDFLGNRSPYADPSMRGGVLGLSLEDPETLLPKVYGATALGIAFGTRQIIEVMRAQGVPIKAIDLSGGHCKSELLVKLYADATGCDLFLPACFEPVLLGAACAAASSLPAFEGFRAAAAAQPVQKVSPDPTMAKALNSRFEAFQAHYPQAQNCLHQPRGIRLNGVHRASTEPQKALQ